MMPLEESTQSLSWQLEDYAYFRKCGEITASPDVQSFGFNCAFCPAICLQFSVFMDHVRDQHTQEVRRRYEGAPEERAEQQTQTDLVIMELDCPEMMCPLDKKADAEHWEPMEADLDAQLMSLLPPATPALHVTTTEAVSPEIDLVYVVENPLPPSPPPSADISTGDELAESCFQALHLELHPDPDPFTLLHDVGTPLPLNPLAEVVAPPPITTPLPRYETRRVVS